jgi:hypothetical protein
MNGPTRTWNAVVVGEDTSCWPGTRRHERLKVCAAQGTARCCAPPNPSPPPTPSAPSLPSPRILERGTDRDADWEAAD